MAGSPTGSARCGTHLPLRSFYSRDPKCVARDLLGTILVHTTEDGMVAGRIVEVEAYLGDGDAAAHSSAGLTPRTRVIFGPPGHAYVYKIYGLHCCLNVVTEPEGTPGCVLVRALEPLAGIALMRVRRGPRIAAGLIASGPGRLTQAMGIGMRQNGADLLASPLTLHLPDGPGRPDVTTTTRVGITRATELALRFFVTDNPFVSRPWH